MGQSLGQAISGPVLPSWVDLAPAPLIDNGSQVLARSSCTYRVPVTVLPWLSGWVLLRADGQDLGTPRNTLAQQTP